MGGYYPPRRSRTSRGSHERMLELILRQGDISAQSRMQGADIWSGLLGQLGQQYDAYHQRKREQGVLRQREEYQRGIDEERRAKDSARESREEAQARREAERAARETEEYERKKREREAIDRAMEEARGGGAAPGVPTGAPPPQPGGVPVVPQAGAMPTSTAAPQGGARRSGIDIEGIASRLPGHMQADFRKTVVEANAAALKYRQAQDDYFGRLALGVRPYLNDPTSVATAVETALRHAEEAGVQGVDEVRQQIKANPLALESIINSLIDRSPTVSAEVRAREGQRPAVGSLEDYINRKYGDNPTPQQIDAARKAYSQADDKPAGPGGRFWVMRDGKPVRITEDQYQPGDKPASTREQGRPVVSGDARRVADLDTSLDDLDALEGALSGSKATGTSAAIGAALPSFVTEATGIGSEAKQKQATIDRVKQVIGKALEEGVLRKEDELKYEKILPTIKDPPAVVAAKIEGLRRAITQRRVTMLDALSDAGYDVGRYRSRQRGGAADPLGLRGGGGGSDPLGLR